MNNQEFTERVEETLGAHWKTSFSKMMGCSRQTVYRRLRTDSMPESMVNMLLKIEQVKNDIND